MTRNRAFGLPLIVLAGLTALAAALRLYRLDTNLWYDEIVTLLIGVRPPLSDILTHFPGNNHHPLYSVLAHVSVQALGESPWTMRLPSAIFGIAAIPALYVLGTLVTTRLESLMAASILTVSYHHIWFSQNARGYTLLLFFVLVSTTFLLRWLARGRASDLVLYVVTTALGAYTHLTMVLVAITHAGVTAWELIVRRHPVRGDLTRAATAFAGAGLLTIALYAPMLVDVQAFFTTERAAANEVATPLWALVEALRGLRIGFGTVWGLTFGALIFGAGVWDYFKRNSAALFLFLLPVPVTLVLAVAMGRPIFPRFVLFAMGFVLLITVRGASVAGTWVARQVHTRISPEAMGTATAGVLTLAIVAVSIRSLPYGYRFPKQDYEQAVAFVENSAKGGDLVAVVGVTGSIPIRDYLGKPWPRIDQGRDLFDLRSRGRDVWVLFTFPAYTELNEPALWAMLKGECVEVAQFEGTIAGGAVVVSRCGPSGS
jgi:uncharacterized membrane protein